MHTHVCSESCSLVSCISASGNSSAYATYCIVCLVHIVYSVCIYIGLSLQAVVRVWHLDWKVQGCFLRPHTRWAQVCRQVHRHTHLPCLQVPSLGMHYDALQFISHPLGSSLVERIRLSFVCNATVVFHENWMKGKEETKHEQCKKCHHFCAEEVCTLKEEEKLLAWARYIL